MLHSTEARRRSSGDRSRRALPRPFLETLEDRTMLDTTGMLRVVNPKYLVPLGPYQLPDPAPALAQPSPFPNVLGNDPGEDGRSAQDTQSETTLVLGNNNTVVVAYNDSFLLSDSTHKFTGYSQSTDAGLSFVDKKSLPTNPDGDAGDPVLARDDVSGRIYLATLTFNGGVINVFRSDDNGATFKAPVNGAPRANANWDKDWLAVDNFPGSGQGNVYLVIRDFGSGNGIYLFRSRDGGNTWTPNGGGQVVSAGQGNVQGAWVTVGPDHAVYVSWLDQRISPERIMIKKSTDGGLTFGPEKVVTTLRTTGVNGDLGFGSFRSNAFAQVAVNPATGDLYIVYPDKGTAAADRADVFFRQSTDGGATWSAAVRVNDDATNRDQWQPALAVSPTGNKIGIFWYDRRNDPANNLIDRYGVIGTVGGDTVTFAANFRITEKAFPPVVSVDPAVNTSYMGDYDQAVATRSHFYVAWGDNRTKSLGHAGNNADVRFASIPVEVAGPAIITSTPRSGTFGDVSSVRVIFDEEIQVPTFTPDQIVSFTGPGGKIAVTGVTAVPNTGNTQFEISFATQHRLGNYSMVIGPDVLDVDGHQMDQNDNGIPGETPGDQYLAKFTIQGPKIIASTPADKLVGPVSSARVTFNEPMDPATFTRDSIFAFKGPKGFIDITAVTVVAGSNNTQFDVKFAPQGITGYYEMDIGPNILDLAGHQLDQNGNFTEGEVPGDRYALAFGLQGPQIIASTPSNFGPGLLGSVQVTFNESMDPATFTSDKIAGFVRAVGETQTDLRATLTTVTPVAGSNNTKININFAATGTTGRYRMVIGPDIRDKFGNQMDQDDNLIPGQIPADQYTLNFTVAGPKIVSAQPDNANTPIFSIRVGFNEPMDVSTFIPAKAQLSGPNGDVPVSAVLPVPGTSFMQFDILFPPSTATGRYTLLIGPDVRDLFDNPMDQNGNFIPGEIPEDQYAVRFTAPGPKIISSTPTGNHLPPFDHMRVTFNMPMDASSFTPDKVASFIGPSGDAIPVSGVAAVPFTNNTQFDISFDPAGPAGNYTMIIGPDIRDIYGNAMDQNGNFIPGEIPQDQYTARFSIVGPQITGITPGGGIFTSSVLPPLDHLRVTFNEPMDPSRFATDQVTSFIGPNGDIAVVAVVPVAGLNNTQFDITFAPQGTTGHYVMVIGPVADRFGNETALFTARFGILGPRITTSSPTQAKPGVDHIRVTFSEPMDPSTFTRDKVASFTGPGGPITVTDVAVVPGTNNSQFDILFDPLSELGSYTMVIGPDIRDPFDNPMDQNSNLVPGEIPGDQYTHHLTISSTTGPGGSAQLPGGNPPFAAAGAKLFGDGAAWLLTTRESWDLLAGLALASGPDRWISHRAAAITMTEPAPAVPAARNIDRFFASGRHQLAIRTALPELLDHVFADVHGSLDGGSPSLEPG